MTPTPSAPTPLDRGAALMAGLEAFDDALIQAIEAAYAGSREVESVTQDDELNQSDINQT